MAKMTIIKSDTFDQMQKFERYTKNGNEKKKLKERLMSEITNALRDEWYTFKDATKAVFDEIVYKASDRGYSFNGYETITNKFNVSIATAKRVVRRLKDTGLVFVAYRKNPRGRGAKTPVIFLKSHPHFEQWRSFLQLEETVCEIASDTVCNSDEPTETSVEDDYSETTYNLPKKYINNNQYSNNVRNFIKYVPKSLQNFQKMFGNSLSDLWLRFNLAIKKTGVKLDKLAKEAIGRNVLNTVCEYVSNGKAQTEEERLKLTYTVAYNYFAKDNQKCTHKGPKVIRREMVPEWMKSEQKQEQEEVTEEDRSAFEKLISRFS